MSTYGRGTGWLDAAAKGGIRDGITQGRNMTGCCLVARCWVFGSMQTHTMACDSGAAVLMRIQWLSFVAQLFTTPEYALSVRCLQVVIIAAGYDTRAYRLASPGVHFYEIDLPHASKKKQELVAEHMPKDKVSCRGFQHTNRAVQWSRIFGVCDSKLWP